MSLVNQGDAKLAAMLRGPRPSPLHENRTGHLSDEQATHPAGLGAVRAVARHRGANEGTFYMAPKNCSIYPAILLIQTARHGATALWLTPHDSGPGIAEKDLGHIFEPLYTTKTEGLGMGLAIVRTIVSVHGGAVGAENNPEGGASLRFTLPVSREVAR
jgi:light-regulated signal transduction histidine kinase (bacteriophytochrome)